MRDIVLFIFVIGGIIATLRYPFVGVLLWAWFSVAAPHQEAFGFSRSLPLNLAIAVVTMGGWFFTKERRFPAPYALYWLILIFLMWMTFNSFFAVEPRWSWQFWDRVWKIFALGLFAAAMATNRVRIQAVIWIVVLSLFYYGVKGGLFVFMTGGQFHVLGPQGSVIADNNNLGLALLMALPLANYLRTQSRNKVVSVALFIGMAAVVVSIIGTYSRGAILGMAALGLFAFFRVRNKLMYVVLVAIILVPVIRFMPEQYMERLQSITEYSSDASFQGRVDAWRVAFLAAVDYFPLGVGFYGPQLTHIFNTYLPGVEPHAAHSIYFQVLGENGFVGLAIYLAMIVMSFIMGSRLMRMARDVPQLHWVRDLAAMIQVSQFAFCVAGAALSMAYYDVFVLNLCLLLPLTEIACRHLAGQPEEKVVARDQLSLEGAYATGGRNV